MKKFSVRGLALGALLMAVGAANAITFSNIQITGPSELIDGSYHVYNTNCDIDFTFDSAWVGDNLPLRTGTIVITFEAIGAQGEMMTGVNLSGNALALGSGIVQVTEIVEDFQNGGTPKVDGVTITAGDSGAFGKLITLDKPSNHLKVKKTIFLNAVETQAMDLAAIGLVEQNFVKTVPEPASMGALALGIAGIVARRRKK